MREGREFAAQRHRDGVLQLRAPHRQDVAELSTLLIESIGQLIDGLAQAIHLTPQRNTEGRRVSVVRRLRAVDVVIGVDDVVAALVLTEDLQAGSR